MRTFLLNVLIAFAFANISPARAQSVSDFFKDKTINIVVPFGRAAPRTTMRFSCRGTSGA